tara:strand:- start:490 stop:960 length:471 start_codon:yes stop_codon:yes gene_type:complete
MYNIFQIKISNEVSDYVNSNDRGHSGAAEKYPEYNANMEVTMRGSEGYTADMFEHYTKVCEVANFESESNKLEEVFKILNGYYFDEDTNTDETFDAFVSGFKMKTYLNKKTKEVSEYRDMHSLSVGDIIEDTSTGKFHIVDGMGFKEVETNTLETA